jgi:hypothetical protein
MARTFLRKIVCASAILGLGIATAPPILPAEAAVAAVPPNTATASGRGWGSMIGCAACFVGGAAIAAGGPASVLIAVNTPGSAIAALACAGACYEAFQ